MVQILASCNVSSHFSIQLPDTLPTTKPHRTKCRISRRSWCHDCCVAVSCVFILSFLIYKVFSGYRYIEMSGSYIRHFVISAHRYLESFFARKVTIISEFLQMSVAILYFSRCSGTMLRLRLRRHRGHRV